MTGYQPTFGDFVAEETTRAISNLSATQRQAVARACISLARSTETPDAVTELWEALGRDVLDADGLFNESWERLLDAFDSDAGRYDEG